MQGTPPAWHGAQAVCQPSTCAHLAESVLRGSTLYALYCMLPWESLRGCLAHGVGWRSEQSRCRGYAHARPAQPSVLHQLLVDRRKTIDREPLSSLAPATTRTVAQSLLTCLSRPHGTALGISCTVSGSVQSPAVHQKPVNDTSLCPRICLHLTVQHASSIDVAQVRPLACCRFGAKG